MSQISVVMPVYNTNPDYLKEAIDSILHQTESDFELIIVDDASTTDIQSVIDTYSDNRIVFYRLPQNGGAPVARNFAISKARGEFLAFLDSDDIAMPDRFEKQLAFLKANPDIGCIGTKAKIFGDDKENMFFPSVSNHTEIERYLMYVGCAFCQSSIMLRKNILDENNILYNALMAPVEDYVLWLDLIGYTRFAILNEPLVMYRYHFANISHRSNLALNDKLISYRIDTIERVLGISFEHKAVFKKLFARQPLLPDEIEKVVVSMNDVLLTEQPHTPAYRITQEMLRHHLKKVYYKTRTVAGQWTLLTNPINKMLEISVLFRLRCFIMRGLL